MPDEMHDIRTDAIVFPTSLASFIEPLYIVSVQSLPPIFAFSMPVSSPIREFVFSSLSVVPFMPIGSLPTPVVPPPAVSIPVSVPENVFFFSALSLLPVLPPDFAFSAVSFAVSVPGTPAVFPPVPSHLSAPAFAFSVLSAHSPVPQFDFSPPPSKLPSPPPSPAPPSPPPPSPSPPPPPPVPDDERVCLNPRAVNFNSTGLHPCRACCIVHGCALPHAVNFDSSATINELAACRFRVYGCLDPKALNFRSSATDSSGNCVYGGCANPNYLGFKPRFNQNVQASCGARIVRGCMDRRALNFNPAANVRKVPSNCLYRGCLLPQALDFDSTASANAGCTFAKRGCKIARATNYVSTLGPQDINQDCVIRGCTATIASNFDPNATAYDGSCVYETRGCAQEEAINYRSSARVNMPEQCVFLVMGCTMRTALNFNSHATRDDGTCIYALVGCTSPSAVNFRPAANKDTVPTSCVYLGCTDPLARNYNSGANHDDRSCRPDPSGCADPAAINYNPVVVRNDPSSCVIVGCTSTLAVNYNSRANVDSGMCEKHFATGKLQLSESLDNCEVFARDASGAITRLNGRSLSSGLSEARSGLFSFATSRTGSCQGCATHLYAPASPSCVESLSGSPLGYPLRAPIGAKLISPLTTLYFAMQTYPFSPRLSSSDVSAALSRCFAISPAVSVLSYQPIFESIVKSDPSARATLFAQDAITLFVNASLRLYATVRRPPPSEATVDAAFAALSKLCDVASTPVWAAPSSGQLEPLLGWRIQERLGLRANSLPNADAVSAAADELDAALSVRRALWLGAGRRLAAEEAHGRQLTVFGTSDAPTGCAASWAANFNSSAAMDDGTCVLPGCTDTSALNFNPLATSDDGSCVARVMGCLYTNASNFNSRANADDGSCVVLLGFGCTDSRAMNYEPLAVRDDGSCAPSVLGCVDRRALNFNSAATVPGTCVYGGCTKRRAANYDSSATVDDGSCATVGCTSTRANNYNSHAGLNDGSCVYSVYGCTQSTSPNFDSAASQDDGSCVVLGCTEPLAINFRSSANANDGSCHTEVTGCSDSRAANYDPYVNAPRPASCLFQGCTDSAALNFDASARLEDGSCVYAVSGCTDSRSFDFDPAAVLDDGSCTYEGCTDKEALNYDCSANVPTNLVCRVPTLGCPDSRSVNYDSLGTLPAECIYPGCLDPGSRNFDSSANEPDLSCLPPFPPSPPPSPPPPAPPPSPPPPTAPSRFFLFTITLSNTRAEVDAHRQQIIDAVADGLHVPRNWVTIASVTGSSPTRIVFRVAWPDEALWHSDTRAYAQANSTEVTSWFSGILGVSLVALDSSSIISPPPSPPPPVSASATASPGALPQPPVPNPTQQNAALAQSAVIAISVSICGCFVLSVAAAVVFYLYRRKQRENAEFSNLNDAIHTAEENATVKNNRGFGSKLGLGALGLGQKGSRAPTTLPAPETSTYVPPPPPLPFVSNQPPPPLKANTFGVFGDVLGSALQRVTGPSRPPAIVAVDASRETAALRIQA